MKNLKVSPEELKMRLSWPVDFKLQWFANRYAEFMIQTDGLCYRAYSGGKDSDIGCLIIDKIHSGELSYLVQHNFWAKLKNMPPPPRVFSNTTNEFPEVVKHAMEYKPLVIRPEMPFTKVITDIGLAIGSKKIARMIRDLRHPTGRNTQTNKLSLTGIKKDGTYSTAFKLPKMFIKAIDAPFEISEKCCDILKKQPFKKYEEETNRRPIVFTMVGESAHRKIGYFQTGCNTLDEGKEKCRPMSIFTDADTWKIAQMFNHKFADVYYDRDVDVRQLDGTYKTESLSAEKTTGCRMCMFGLHKEVKSKNNRIQRLAISDPKFYDLLINKYGFKEVFEYLDIKYKPDGQQTKMKL